MVEANVHAGQFITVLIIAVALGFDAFSLGLGIGLKGIRIRDILKLGTVIALFHVLMPIGGMLTGQLVSGLIGHIASAVAGVLLILLGGHMMYSSIRGGTASAFDHRSVLGLLVLAFSVSIDSFSVGVSLGIFSVDFGLTVFLFGFFGGLMSMLGLLLGRNVGSKLGEYGEACGGAVLLGFGILFII